MVRRLPGVLVDLRLAAGFARGRWCRGGGRLGPEVLRRDYGGPAAGAPRRPRRRPSPAGRRSCGCLAGCSVWSWWWLRRADLELELVSQLRVDLVVAARGGNLVRLDPELRGGSPCSSPGGSGLVVCVAPAAALRRWLDSGGCRIRPDSGGFGSLVSSGRRRGLWWLLLGHGAMTSWEVCGLAEVQCVGVPVVGMLRAKACRLLPAGGVGVCGRRLTSLEAPLRRPGSTATLGSCSSGESLRPGRVGRRRRHRRFPLWGVTLKSIGSRLCAPWAGRSRHCGRQVPVWQCGCLRGFLCGNDGGFKRSRFAAEFW